MKLSDKRINLSLNAKENEQKLTNFTQMITACSKDKLVYKIDDLGNIYELNLKITRQNDKFQDKQPLFCTGTHYLLNLQHLYLDFSEFKLAKVYLDKLFQSLTTLSNLKSLRLRFSDSGVTLSEKANDLFIHICLMSKLELLELKLPKNNLTSQSIELFSSDISKLSQLESLSLDFSGMQFKTKTLRQLCQSISSISVLQSLSINLTNTSSENIGECFKTYFPHLKNLQYLSLSIGYIYLQQNDINDISQGLKRMPKLTLLQLDLDSSEVNNDSLVFLVSVIKNMANLQTLALGLNRTYPQPSFPAILYSTIESLTQLNYLSLSLKDNKVNFLNLFGYKSRKIFIKKFHRLVVYQTKL